MLRPIRRGDLIRRLREFGFQGPFAGGKHSFMSKGSLNLRIPNPHQRDIGRPLLREILREAGIDPVDWE